MNGLLFLYVCITLYYFLRKKLYAIGAATKSDDNVPNTTPRIIANEKLRMLSPPSTKIQSNTIMVLTDVLIVRANVVLSDVLNRSNLLRFG